MRIKEPTVEGDQTEDGEVGEETLEEGVWTGTCKTKSLEKRRRRGCVGIVDTESLLVENPSQLFRLTYRESFEFEILRFYLEL